ncbi:Uncharacterised protein [Mycobacteroides abscessus]|nr:Uncharacterised protein [Mycobacteroides abscessus]
MTTYGEVPSPASGSTTGPVASGSPSRSRSVSVSSPTTVTRWRAAASRTPARSSGVRV